MSKPRIAILTGFGLNCEAETAFAFERAGGIADLIHINDLIENIATLDSYQILTFIGGFSFGDHIASGRALAIKFKYRLQDKLTRFMLRDSLILGICNGFQTLVKMGILPGNEQFQGNQVVTLTHNRRPGYWDDWVTLKANPKSPCVFSRGVSFLDCPVRHGEGRFLYQDESVAELIRSQEQIVFQYVNPDNHEVALEFPANPNGSPEGIAAICDPTGRILGIMPHPEAFHSYLNHPLWTNTPEKAFEEGAGIRIFRNAIEYFN